MRRRLLIGLLLVPFLVGALVLWGASSEMALQWAARKVTEASGGALTVTGVSGSLAHTLRIDHILYRSPERAIKVDDAEVTWSPLQLLHDRVAISRVTASAVIIESLKPSDKPLLLPEKLALPLELRIDEVRMAKVVFVKQGVSAELQDLHFRLAGNALQWQLQDLGFETAFGSVGGSVTLETARPFQVVGSLQFQSDEASAAVAVSGTLGEMVVDANLAGYGGTAKADAIITLFEPSPLKLLRANARGIDPSRVRPGWPKADLQVTLDGGIGPDQSLHGDLMLRNAMPGTIDHDLLPLVSARARLGGTQDAARLSGVVLDFGKAGQFTGSGSATKAGQALVLHTARFDLKGISSRMNATRLSGDIALSDKENSQKVDARLGQDRLRLDLLATKSDSIVHLQEAVLRAGGGRASAEGEIDLSNPRPFRLKGIMQHFDPASFGAYPVADLNLDFDLQGYLTQQWQLSVRYDIRPSRLLGQPLSGKGSFSADSSHVKDVDAVFTLGPNSASAHGGFGKKGDRLQWRVDAPRLAAFGADYAGALKGEGELGGSFESPRLSIQMNGSELRIGAFAARTVSLSANAGEGESDPLRADFHVGHAKVSGHELNSLSTRIEGTRNAHTIDISANNESIDIIAQAAGGWRAGAGWEGTLGTLENRGRYAFSLESPASLRARAGEFSIQDMTIGLAGGRIHLASLDYAGARFSTSGTATRIPLSWLMALSPAMAQGIDTNLLLGADWSLAVGNTVDGGMHVFRQSGDITLRGYSTGSLGLDTLDIQAGIVKNAVQFDASIRGATMGNMHLAGKTQLARRNGSWGLPRQSPLQLAANASVPSLAWIGPLSGNPGIDVGGQAALALTGSGTIGNPRLAGEIAGDSLSVKWPEQGINLHGGVLRAQFQDGALQLQQASIRGGEGTLKLEGGARMANSQLVVTMRLIADKLLLLSRPDRVLAISGESTLSLDQNRLQFNGTFQADRARIEFSQQKDVTFSDDVVVLGRERKKAEERKPLPILYDINVDLGRQFYIKGRGVDARLTGSARVYSGPDRLPRARGTIQVAEGTYDAYGQKLTIQKGIFTFNGPINNPSLDILAVRKVANVDNAVEAGVTVRGTALSPNAHLVSTPSVPDTEKLSWLVLGKGTDQAGRQDFSILAAAAGALFGTSQAESMQSRLANTLGIDELGVGMSGGTSSTSTTSSTSGTTSAKGLENTVVTLGKRISSRVYLTFEQGVTGATSLVKFRYLLSRRLSLEIGTGTSSSVDVMYNWRFD